LGECEEGKRVYAFKGPAIHKWKKDENGLIEKDNKKDFKIDLSDEIIFYSLLCSPYVSDYINYYGTEDLRFIADTELLDIAEHYYKPKLKTAKSHKKNKYQRKLDGKDDLYYGIFLDEVGSVRKLVKPGENEAVYFITSYQHKINTAVSYFCRMHNQLKESEYKHKIIELVHKPFLNALREQYEETRYDMDDMSAGELIHSGILEKNGFDSTNPNDVELIQSICLDKAPLRHIHEDSLTKVSQYTHDRIPHSFIGSLFKSGELSTIIELLGEETTNSGIKGFPFPGIELEHKYHVWNAEDSKTAGEILFYCFNIITNSNARHTNYLLNKKQKGAEDGRT
jgi:hypothetical protein